MESVVEKYGAYIIFPRGQLYQAGFFAARQLQKIFK